MISFSCPKCKAFLSVDDHQAASKYACPSCGQLMRVPTPGTALKEPAGPAANFTASPPRTPLQPALASAGQVQYDGGRPFVTWSCTYCNARLKAALEHAGQSIQCPSCQHTLPIPDPHGRPALHGVGTGSGVGTGVGIAGVGGAARSHTGLIVGLAAGMVVLVGVVVGLVVWQPWAGKSMLHEDQLKFLPDQTDIVAAVNMQELLASSVYRKADAAVSRLGGVSFKQIEEKVRQEVGLSWSDLTRVLIGAKFNDRGDFTVVLQTRQAVQAGELLRKIKHGKSFTEEKIGPYTIYKNEQLGQLGQAFCVAADSTIVVGSAAMLRQVLQRNKKPVFSPTLQTAMNQTDFTSTTIAAAMGRIPSATLRQMNQGFAGLGNLSQLLSGSLDKTEGGTLEVRVGADVKIKTLTICSDAKTAQDMKSTAEGMMTLLKVGGLPPALADLFKPIEFHAQGNQLITTMTIDIDKMIKIIEDQKKFGRGF